MSDKDTLVFKEIVRIFTGYRQNSKTGKITYCYIGEDGTSIVSTLSPEKLGFIQENGVWKKNEN